MEFYVIKYRNLEVNKCFTKKCEIKHLSEVINDLVDTGVFKIEKVQLFTI